MRRPALILAGATLATAALVASTLVAAQPPAAAETGTMAKFTLTSTDLTDGGRIADAHVFNQFGCTGGNVSPALSWSGAPAGTQSFALLMHDPDAPTGSGWWHWVVYNIPANTTSLPAGAGDPKKKLMPAGAVQGRTDYGSIGYGGPCPPPGNPHHYHVHLYALKVPKLDLPADASAAMVGFNVRAQALGHAEIVALYGR
ncbi:MAG TPA: YbhB/YbcL family Raf kinase inhibitor-like protein [Steroidobacteraceae bacterium]|nr:YbhB/YbcL family Raf kinase inhibitor-like protein [Steroidobacteraceae bacterium]